MSGRIYNATLGVILFMAFLGGIGRVPFTPGFRWVAITFLSLWVAVPWFVIRFRIGWKLAGFVAAFAGSLGLLQWTLAVTTDPINASTIVIIGLCADWVILSFLLANPKMKSVILAQNICVIYAVLLWAFLRNDGISSSLGSSPQHLYDAQFMFWPPFLATTLWASIALVKRNVLTVLALAVTVAQPGIGFTDLQLTMGVRWGLGAAFLCILAFLGLAIWCLKFDATPKSTLTRT
jgi:hypothetical protein